MVGSCHITKSCGNVFEDIQVENPAEALAKAETARKLCLIIEEQGLMEARAAQDLVFSRLFDPRPRQGEKNHAG